MRRVYDAFGDAEFRARHNAIVAATAASAAMGTVPIIVPAHPSAARPHRSHVSLRPSVADETATATATAEQPQSGVAMQTVKATLETMYHGCTAMPLTYTRFVQCSKCRGTGASRLVVCVDCGGSGTNMLTAEPCKLCGGDGSIAIPQQKCADCKGRKVVSDSATISIALEPGVADGAVLLFPGYGHFLPNKKEFGELVVNVQMVKHKLFHRSGADLVVKARISLREALCGYVLRVPHLSGREILLRSPPGKVTRPGDALVVDGQGMPVPGSNGQSFGRLVVHLDVEFPKDNAFSSDDIAALEKVLPSDSHQHFVPVNSSTSTPSSEEPKKRTHDEVSSNHP